jgi:carbon storage regulator CsrA
MLVLARRLNEKIVITTPDGTRIVLTLVECRVGKARIGIEAPVAYLVYRGEMETASDGT